jgi:hypothetical protein
MTDRERDEADPVTVYGKASGVITVTAKEDEEND